MEVLKDIAIICAISLLVVGCTTYLICGVENDATTTQDVTEKKPKGIPALSRPGTQN